MSVLDNREICLKLQEVYSDLSCNLKTMWYDELYEKLSGSKGSREVIAG